MNEACFAIYHHSPEDTFREGYESDKWTFQWLLGEIMTSQKEETDK